MSTLKHYPTPTTTTYYIGEYRIDDMYRVDFTRKKTDQPIWGYASKQFDFIAKGREIVTGNIVINFRYPGYLTNVLIDTLDDSASKRSMIKSGYDKDKREIALDALNDLDAVDTTEAKMQYIGDLLGQSLDPLIHQDKDGWLKQDSSPLSYDSANGLSSFPKVNEMRGIQEELKLAMFNRYINSFSEFDDSPKHTKSPLDIKDLKPFDMHVVYGFQEMYGNWRRTFKDVTLIGESQTVQAGGDGGGMGSSAQSLLEIYPFFCKSILVGAYN